MESNTFEQISMLFEKYDIDEFDILDSMIFDFYKEEQSANSLYSSDNLILIEGKLGISKNALLDLFKICKPLAK